MRVSAIAAIAAFGLCSGSDGAVYVANTSSTYVFPTPNIGDRGVAQLEFNGTSSVLTEAGFNQWTDGRFTRNTSGGGSNSFQWSDPIPRDMNSSGNLYSGNPDRADNSTPYPGEASSTARLSDVFGANSISGSQPFQNLGYIIDGEEIGQPFGPDQIYYQIDLLYGQGRFIRPDADTTTVELAVLERGLNSSIRVYGLVDPAGTTTTATSLLLDFRSATQLYLLDTLEIDGAQPVGGLGASLDLWSGLDLYGFRLQFDANGVNMDGPDIVGVGTVAAVPEPATFAQAGIGGALLLMGLAARRRRARAA